MPSKGTSCCRDDCQGVVSPDNKCCCSKVCDAICVTIKMDGCPDDCADAEEGCDSDCGCNCVTAELPWVCGSQAYVGSITCGEMTIDLMFSLVNCDEGPYGGCSLCLSSDCLGMYGACDTDDCVGVSGKAQCSGCEDGIIRTGGMSGSWSVDLSSCGNAYCGGATIETACVEVILPSKIVDCQEPLCLGCDCACRCICITYSDDNCGETVRACWDEYAGGWSASIECPYETIEVQVNFAPNEYTGECELTLTTSVGDGDPVAANCPDISAAWTITKPDYSTATVSISCSNCGECDNGVIPCPACPDILLPRVLNASVDGGYSCDCAVFDLTLTYDDTLGYWVGTDPTAWCDHNVELQFACESDGRLLMAIVNSGPCADVSDRVYGQSCDPLSVAFSINVAGLGCCNGTDSSRIINITVTE